MEISFIGRKMYIDLTTKDKLEKAKKNLEYNYDYQVLNIIYNDIENVKEFLKLINDTTLINLYEMNLSNTGVIKRDNINHKELFKNQKVLSYIDISTLTLNDFSINKIASIYDGVRLRPERFYINKENSSNNLIKLLEKKHNLIIKSYYSYADLNTLNLESLYDFYKNIFVFERNNNIDLLIGLEVMRVFEGEYELSADTKYKKFDIDVNLCSGLSLFNKELEKNEKTINRNFNTIDTLYYPFTEGFVKYISNFMNINTNNSN